MIAKVIDLVLTGWTEGKYSHDSKVFQLRKDELLVLDGYLLWGSRIVIPAEDRDRRHKCNQSRYQPNEVSCLQLCLVAWNG